MEPVIGAIRINQTFASAAVLILVIGVLFTGEQNDNFHPSSFMVSAYHLFPFAKFYLNFQNRITSIKNNVVRLDCEKIYVMVGGSRVSHKLDVVWIPQNHNWGFDFRTGIEEVDYECKFYCLGLQGHFSAFVDLNKFEDDLCGGRHCTWMFNDDGLYLFNLKDEKYHLKIDFRSTTMNNGTGNGTNSGVVLRFKPAFSNI